MPTHHNLDRYLEEYIAAAGIGQDRKGPLFRTSKGRGGELADRPLLQSDVWLIIRRKQTQLVPDSDLLCAAPLAIPKSNTEPDFSLVGYRQREALRSR